MSANPDAGAAVIRVLVASDLHVVSGPESDDSYLATAPSAGNVNGDPFTGALKLIEQEKIRADIVLCPGDIGNRADPAAIKYAWDRLHELRDAVQAKHLVASSGNHDFDSRLIYNKYDPTETLKALQPRYPIASESEAHRYWTDHFGLVEMESVRIVSLNSSAYHWLADEREQGRVSTRTIGELTRYLSQAPQKLVNVLLCHHHPHRHPELRNPNSSPDVMVDGNLLIEALSSGEHGEWLIVHGHKHFPNLSYAAGQVSPPIVLSCGSFSARLYKELQTLARNQLYLIEIPLSDCQKWGLVGVVRAWDWAYGRGWGMPEGVALPTATPFGARDTPSVYAMSIRNRLSAGTYKLWSELVADIPMLAYLPPLKAKQVFQVLRDRHNCNVEMDGHFPVQISISEMK